MLTLFNNYGPAGMYAAGTLLLVFKFHRPFEVALWTVFMRKFGKVSQRDIKEHWKQEAGKRGEDFLIQLSQARAGRGVEAQEVSSPPKAGPTPRKPTSSTTASAASTTTTRKRPPAKQQPTPVTPLPEPPSTGRHARPDNDGGEVHQFPKATEDPQSGRHSVA